MLLKLQALPRLFMRQRNTGAYTETYILHPRLVYCKYPSSKRNEDPAVKGTYCILTFELRQCFAPYPCAIMIEPVRVCLRVVI